MENLNAFMRLTKADAAQQMVWGVLAAEVADHSREIMDYETAVPAFKSWSVDREQATGGKSLGNIRAQHGNVIAGVLKEITYDADTKSILGKAHIIDINEWNKVAGGAYTGFSIGGAYAKCWADAADLKLTRYTPILKEISIVDVPCIPVAKFEYVKADGTMEMRKFKAVVDAEEVGVAVQQGWQAKDGTFFKAKQDAIDHNLSVELTKASDAVTGALDALAKAKEALASPTEAPLKKATEAEPAKDGEGKIVTEADVKKADDADALKKAALAECVKAASDTLGKRLIDIGTVVDAITSLSWLQDGLEWDTIFVGKETTLPADLKPILGSLCDFLSQVVADATATLTAEKAAGLSLNQVEALRKATGNAELLKDFKPADPAPDNTALEKAAADAAALTTELEATKTAKGDLEKTVTELTDGIKEMTKGITDLKSVNVDMAKRLEHLEAQPAMAKGVKYQTLLNGHEGPDTTEVPVEVDMRKYNGMSPDEAREQMRKDSKRK
ncbi:hypothetical protein [Rhodopila sp.]|uniref:hypothetical protein n=1 Tax=Rhodopila sp. TaxID=2480087 RepID=UPI003D0A678C